MLLNSIRLVPISEDINVWLSKRHLSDSYQWVVPKVNSVLTTEREYTKRIVSKKTVLHELIVLNLLAKTLQRASIVGIATRILN